MKKSPLNILSKDGKLLSSAEGSAAYRKSALNMLGISRKSSPLNDMAGGLTHEEMRKKSPQNLEGHLKNREAHQRGVSRNSSPLNDNDSIRNDSINRDIAIKKFKEGYDKVGKVKSGEYDREKGEFHWDGNKISLIPTDDAERQNTTGLQPKTLGINWE